MRIETLLIIIALCCFIGGAVTGATYMFFKAVIYRKSVKEEIKEKIINREMNTPQFKSVEELNSYLQGYACCQNDILDMFERGEFE